LPSNVIAAWPQEDRAPGFIAGLHWAINRTGGDGELRRRVLTFEEFGLSYPITKIDLIENWEGINTLMSRSLHSYERGIIIRHAISGGPIEDIIERYP